MMSFTIIIFYSTTLPIFKYKRQNPKPWPDDTKYFSFHHILTVSKIIVKEDEQDY